MTSLVPKLYTHPFSHGRISRWLLEEIGEPYDVEIIDIDAAGTHDPAEIAKVAAMQLGLR